jgi:hypothetical protein
MLRCCVESRQAGVVPGARRENANRVFAPARAAAAVKEIFTSGNYLAGVMRASVRLVVDVTFDERRGGYVATGPGLATVTALSLSSLRKRIEAQLPPTEAVKLELDRVARRERDRRRAR